MTMVAGNAAEARTVAAPQPNRISDRDLAAISNRLRSIMNDEGYRAYYPSDVSSLFGEVLALRQMLSKATQLLSGPPLHDVVPGTGIIEIADRLAEVWQDHERKLYEKKEMKLMRDRLQDMGTNLAGANKRIEGLLAEIESLKSELREFGRVREELQASQSAHKVSEARVAELSRQIRSLEAEVRELARIRDEGEAIRQSQSALIARHAERIERARVLNIELTSVIGTA
jgi:predicted RNase H-like nuclease (RuvC/YqgF family)